MRMRRGQRSVLVPPPHERQGGVGRLLGVGGGGRGGSRMCSYSVTQRVGLGLNELTNTWGWIRLRTPAQGSGRPRPPPPPPSPCPANKGLAAP